MYPALEALTLVKGVDRTFFYGMSIAATMDEPFKTNTDMSVLKELFGHPSKVSDRELLDSLANASAQLGTHKQNVKDGIESFANKELTTRTRHSFRSAKAH